jgi:hypothetical protein
MNAMRRLLYERPDAGTPAIAKEALAGQTVRARSVAAGGTARRSIG